MSNLVRAIAIVVAADALAIAALLWVRRRAPEGSYFADGDRASGVFGVLATGLAIFAGFAWAVALFRSLRLAVPEAATEQSAYRPGVGSIQPVAMERSPRILDEARAVLSDQTPLPCDANGVAA